jgi:putative membrane protein
VTVDSWTALAVAALVLGVVNAFVRPILTLLTLPITVLTLGLFLLIVNGTAFALAAWVVPGFSVDGFWWAVLGALLVSIFSAFVGKVAGEPGR